MNEQTQNRRWFSAIPKSIRLAIAVCTVIAIASVFFCHDRHQQISQNEERLKYTIYWNSLSEDEQKQILRLRNVREAKSPYVTLDNTDDAEVMATIAGRTDLTEIWLSSIVSDRDILAISKLNSISRLWIQYRQGSLSEVGLKSLGLMTRLKSLQVQAGPSQNLDDVLVAIKECSSLTELHVDGQISSRGMNAIVNQKNLQNLNLRACQIPNEDLYLLRELRAPKNLNLFMTGVTDDHIRSYPPWRSLEILSLTRCPITDDGLAAATKWRNITEIYLSETNITRKSVSSIMSFKRLKIIEIPHVFNRQDLQIIHRLVPAIEGFSRE